MGMSSGGSSVRSMASFSRSTGCANSTSSQRIVFTACRAGRSPRFELRAKQLSTDSAASQHQLSPREGWLTRNMSNQCHA